MTGSNWTDGLVVAGSICLSAWASACTPAGRTARPTNATPDGMPSDPQSGDAGDAAKSTDSSQGSPLRVSASSVAMQLVPGGIYIKGSRFGDRITGGVNEAIRFRVRVAPFEIDRTEVTRAAYEVCIQAGACDPIDPKCKPDPAGGPDHPVTCVDALAAAKYCKWLGKRLPTDSEWEYAARDGGERKYPWGNDPPNDICFGRNQDPGRPGGTVGTCAVGTHAQDTSPFGVVDMAGNVSEWTSSFDERGYDDPAERGGYEPFAGLSAIRRGGAWMHARDADLPWLMARVVASEASGAVGFRCARSYPDAGAPWARPPEPEIVDPLPSIREGQMVHIPGAEVRLPGAPADAGQSLTVAPFDIDVAEVSAEAYSKCVKAKRCVSTVPTEKNTIRYEETHPRPRTEGQEQLAHHPINDVSAKQAIAYCAWVGKRLPTEAEWELAARGTDGRTLPWGEPDSKKKPCWNRPWGVEAYTGTCPVATHPDDVSPYGVYDMAGNVRELVLWMGLSREEGSRDATTPSRYVALGFSWDHVSKNEWWRMEYNDDFSGDESVGFRCAR